MTRRDYRPTASERAAALGIVDHATGPLTARTLIREIAQQLKLHIMDARRVLTDLVDRQKLGYQDLYGSTCVIKNFLRPVPVTPHFSLVPSNITRDRAGTDTDTCFIHLAPGISFGLGHHPTTRLCLAAIDHLLFSAGLIRSPSDCYGIDIGTGSGVLAIAMCAAGLGRCSALDIDPNAVMDASRNVALNHLSSRISVAGHSLSAEGPGVSVICANLRPPTLHTLAPVIRSRLIPGGAVVLSGFRDTESEPVIIRYARQGLHPVWQQTENGWHGLIVADGKNHCHPPPGPLY